MNYNAQINGYNSGSNKLWRPSKFFQTNILGSTCGGVSIFNRNTWMSNLYAGSEDLFSNSNGYSGYGNGYLNNNNYNDYFANKYNTTSNSQKNEILQILKEFFSSLFSGYRNY